MTRKLDFGLLAALILPAVSVLPLLPWNGIPNTADGVIHLLRQVGFDHAIRAGVLVPRWGADLYLGFGYPLYNFAPPLLAYVIETFVLAGIAMDAALALTVILTLELYSAGMFLFMRPRVGAAGALAAAALYVYAPFRMREALVTGGNYPQFLAMALFPFVLWAFDGLLRTQARRYAVAAVASLAALWLSHLFHAAIFTPIAALYVLVQLLVTRAGRTAWLAALGTGALALAVSAFFWMPALVEAPLTGASAAEFAAASDFHQRFLTAPRLLALPAPLDFGEANADVPLAIGWPQVIAGAAGALVVIGRRRDRAHALFLIALAAVAIFLQLGASSFIWDAVPILPLAEYPWRFMGLATLALAALGGYAVSLVPPRAQAWTALAIAGLAIASVMPYTTAPRGTLHLGAPTAENVMQYESSTGARGLTTLDEYLPKSVQALPADLPAPLGRTKLDLPAALITADRWSPRGEDVTVELPSPVRVRFRTFYFPDWQAAIDGREVPVTVAADGTFAIDAPAGRHTLTTRFADSPVRTAATLISLAGVFMLALAAWRWPFGASRANVDDAGDAGNARRFALWAALIVLALGAKAAIDANGGLRATPRSVVAASFGGQLELMGSAQDEGVVARGAELQARFYWRPAQPLAVDYKVIAQLIAPDGRAVAGSDKQHPGDPVTQGETPTSQIADGKVLRDEHVIRVPETVAPGRYELRVGLYDPITGKRLRLPDGETLFTTGTVEVR
ncbi:MAG: hypothetical protein HZB53_01505 [Chloroflexi bacterium]|nr:hypothetical protein [Chloroflexota bacterium]